MCIIYILCTLFVMIMRVCVKAASFHAGEKNILDWFSFVSKRDRAFISPWPTKLLMPCQDVFLGNSKAMTTSTSQP